MEVDMVGLPLPGVSLIRQLPRTQEESDTIVLLLGCKSSELCTRLLIDNHVLDCPPSESR